VGLRYPYPPLLIRNPNDEEAGLVNSGPALHLTKSLNIMHINEVDPAPAAAKEIEFQAPKGFSPPEDSTPGQPFEVMASVRMKENGMLCLEAIDGVSVSPEEQAETPEEENAEDNAPSDKKPAAIGFLAAIEDGVSKTKK